MTRFLQRPGGRIAYDDTGAGGALVVCTPGMGDTRASFRFLAPVLAAAGYRVVTLDVRGHGESDTGFGDHSAAAIGDDLVALLELLDAGPATLAGVSMAAAASVWAAAAAAERVAGLVLIGPFVRDVPATLVQRIGARLLVAGPWAAKAWSLWYGRLFPTAPPADLAAQQARIAAMLKEPARLAALRAMLAASKADCEARMPEVTARTLVIMGTADPDFTDPAAEARLIAERLRGGVVLIEGAGHYPHAEFPEQTAAALLPFLADLHRGAAGSPGARS